MIQDKPAMSNKERQRRFRERHPHYYRDLHRRRNAEAALYAAQANKVQPPATPKALPAPTPQIVINLPLFAEVHVE